VSSSPRPPALPRLPAALEPAELSAEQLSAGGKWAEVIVEGASLTGVEARDVDFDEARLVACDLSGAALARFGTLDCELVRCNLANVMARDSSMVRTSCVESRLTGLQWPEGGLQDVAFRDCRIDLASFRFARMQRVVFEDCVLRDADFTGARFESVRFDGCDLSAATFGGAQFERSELRGCRLEGLRGVDGLRGAALEWPAIVDLAPAFAAALGVRVIADEAQRDGAP
jgi:uncharacterized protein YjbI with pentapeptide repeats